MAALVAHDPRLAPVLAKAGDAGAAPARGRLCRALRASSCGQQLSTASAGAIWGRLFAAFDPFHHDAVRRARADKLARLGLSRPKIKTLKAIGTADRQGRTSISTRSPTMAADEAHAALTALHGIGPWTADIYLLFCLGHADAWPAGDLALQEAARIAFGLRKRPDAEGDGQARRDLAAVARRWRRICCGPTIAW